MRTLIIAILSGLLVLPSHLAAQQAVTLADGGRVYSQSCGRCHNPRAPNERSDREWDVITAHMRTRANLSGRETRAVLLFLQTTNGIEGDGGGMMAPNDPKTLSGSLAPRQSRAAVQNGGNVDEGRKLVEAKACIACHSIGEHKSGVLGPDLNTVFTRRSEEWVMEKLTDPRTDNAATVMPQMDLTQSERDAIMAYMKSVAKK